MKKHWFPMHTQTATPTDTPATDGRTDDGEDSEEFLHNNAQLEQIFYVHIIYTL